MLLCNIGVMHLCCPLKLTKEGLQKHLSAGGLLKKVKFMLVFSFAEVPCDIHVFSGHLGRELCLHCILQEIVLVGLNFVEEREVVVLKIKAKA